MNTTTAIISLALVTLILLSCSTSPTGTTGDSHSIGGVLEAWQPGVFQDRVRFGIVTDSWFLPLDSTLFDPDGKFTFSYPFPSAPDSTLKLYQPNRISNGTVEITDSVIFSGTDPRYAIGQINVYARRAGISSSLTQMNSWVSSDSAIAVGDYYQTFCFFTSATKLSGWKRTTIKLPATSTYKYRVFLTRLDLQTSDGWNALTTRIESIHDSTLEYRVSGQSFSSGKWYQAFGIPYNFSNAFRW